MLKEWKNPPVKYAWRPVDYGLTQLVFFCFARTIWTCYWSVWVAKQIAKYSNISRIFFREKGVNYIIWEEWSWWRMLKGGNGYSTVVSAWRMYVLVACSVWWGSGQQRGTNVTPLKFKNGVHKGRKREWNKYFEIPKTLREEWSG